MRMSRSLRSFGSAVVCLLAATVTATAVAQQAAFPMKILETPQPILDLPFIDATGRETSLGAFRGKVVLLNVWATWCPPCRQEMPSLDRLQRALGGPRFEVVALSLDSGRLQDVASFYEEYGIENLGVFIDETDTAMRALRIIGLPTTLLIDEQGGEIGRKLGPAEWDGAEALVFLRERIANGSIGTEPPHE